MPKYRVVMTVSVECIADDGLTASGSMESMIRKYIPTPTVVEWVTWKEIDDFTLGKSLGSDCKDKRDAAIVRLLGNSQETAE